MRKTNREIEKERPLKRKIVEKKKGKNKDT
jgi:hypothetical protein